MKNSGYLGEFELIVIMAVMRLGHNAYGMTVRKEIADRSGRDVSIGAVYTTLDRLEKKGFVRSGEGKKGKEYNNRPKRFFEVMEVGKMALNRTWSMFQSMSGELVSARRQ